MGKNWLQVLRDPGEAEMPPDVREVTEAAYALRVSEFNLFRLAYRRWHGHEAEEKPLEKVFVAYLFRQRAPLWVRHFCRQVLAEDAAGRLERQAFGADEVPRREPLVAYRRGFIGLTMVVLFLGYLVIRLVVG